MGGTDLIYFNDAEIGRIGVDWESIRSLIVETIATVSSGDYSQPVKPYLRYRAAANRIIAMPAFIGGPKAIAGIKWIASFPGNLDKGMPRAHSVTVLNEADTGLPLAIINSSRISTIRTAGVSGAVIHEFLEQTRGEGALVLGIIGMGPIGRAHLEMASALFPDRITEVRVFDLKEISLTDFPEALHSRVRICGSWEMVFDAADVFITSTVSKARYIDRAPKPGSLHLNISLRDYHPQMLHCFQLIMVDDWDEVCRENTDIEAMHKTMGLEKDDTLNLGDIFLGRAFTKLGPAGCAMFNPMGMAAFDIALGGYYYHNAVAGNDGVKLPD